MSNGYSVLIIDDDETLAGIMAESLKDAADNIFICNDTNNAVKKAKALKPQLIIIDVQLRSMSGFDLGLEIKRVPELEDVPIVFISSSKNKDYPLIAFTLGAAAFLTKPLNVNFLVQEAKMMMDMCQFKRLAKKALSYV